MSAGNSPAQTPSRRVAILSPIRWSLSTRETTQEDQVDHNLSYVITVDDADDDDVLYDITIYDEETQSFGDYFTSKDNVVSAPPTPSQPPASAFKRIPIHSLLNPSPESSSPGSPTPIPATRPSLSPTADSQPARKRQRVAPEALYNTKWTEAEREDLWNLRTAVKPTPSYARIVRMRGYRRTATAYKAEFYKMVKEKWGQRNEDTTSPAGSRPESPDEVQMELPESPDEAQTDHVQRIPKGKSLVKWTEAERSDLWDLRANRHPPLSYEGIADLHGNKRSEAAYQREFSRMRRMKRLAAELHQAVAAGDSTPPGPAAMEGTS